jgi:hypothetical protein
VPPNDENFPNTDSLWYDGEFGFVLKNSKPFKTPIPYKGQLNLFNVNKELVEEEIQKAFKGK